MEIVFVRNGLNRITKKPVICKKENGVLTPIVYFQKPAGANQKDFDAAVDFLIKQAEKTIKK